MRLFKFATAGLAVVSIMSASAAMAATSRSASAIPVAQKAPVNGVRDASMLKRKSNQSDDSGIGMGYVLGGVVLAGTVAAAIVGSDNDSDEGAFNPDSPG